MKTEDLIQALKADTGRRRPSPDLLLLIALALGTLWAGAVLLSTMGVRPDFATALGTIRFPFKFAVTIALAATAALVFRRSLFPVASQQAGSAVLVLAPLILIAGAAVELAALPAEAWSMAATGKNAALCLTVIPALGAAPLAAFLWVLRRGASMRPVLAGLSAGLLAGGIAATFYAANCTDDSPLFVAVWYPMAVGILGLAGAVLGRLVAKW